MSKRKTILRVENFVKSYEEGKLAVDHLSFDVKEGEVFALIGKSGCGKTTSLKLLSGQMRPDDGSAYIYGERILGPHERLLAGHDKIALVEQDYNLFNHQTVADNIKYPIRRSSKKYQEYRLKELLRICELEDYRDTRPKELSGGQKQRVAIARAIADEPPVLLLDEPFSHLDMAMRSDLRRMVKNIAIEANISVVFVTHDTHDALSMSDRIGVMSHGKILQIASPEEIYKQPLNGYAAHFFPHCNVLTSDQLASIGIQKEKGEYMARPEWLDVVEADNSEHTATLKHIDYFGNASYGEWEFEQGFSIWIHHDSFFTIKIGEKRNIQMLNHVDWWKLQD
ncbi:ATP-binding cassette domain-containing protein [Flammeovirga yaeyamensis]|uniref:ATP-binding cassette domain-containing protein n=1 Tax=Flammeovirga yaeyamensis TaxID=367791 RepID=A0AAX1N4M3_9BACT|nr:ABC transporter ATP-binding protein [Flammeovirga yaeyamensis]MBB3700267.1 iron(III) transport system ATP-binding protein [Flammeovirga yaeyamensis]NMF37107.1 ABC transporter ATP-binding protein [Flammeovirga yaeyamensis]QWG00798.1 ATP-binding cassette domain-containing protein [Flammeovirga yaeyamensis]